MYVQPPLVIPSLPIKLVPFCMTFIHWTFVCVAGKKNCANISSWIDLSMPWNMYFSFAIWSLWLHRNKVVFRNSPLNRELNRELWAVASEFMYWASPTRLVKRKQVIKVRWNKPKLVWLSWIWLGAPWAIRVWIVEEPYSRPQWGLDKRLHSFYWGLDQCWCRAIGSKERVDNVWKFESQGSGNWNRC